MTPVPDFRVDDPAQIEQIAVGDRVRSYSFEFADDSYVEGEVEYDGDIMEGCPRYRIAVTRWVHGGIESDRAVDANTVYPPVNGTPHSFGGYCNGVRKVG